MGVQPLIPTLRNQKQIDLHEFRASLHNKFLDSKGHIKRPCLKNKNNRTKLKTSKP